jgi:hypothetical protein
MDVANKSTAAAHASFQAGAIILQGGVTSLTSHPQVPRPRSRARVSIEARGTRNGRS